MSKYAGLDRNDTFEPVPVYCFQNNWGQAWGVHSAFGLTYERRARVATQDAVDRMLEELRVDAWQMARELGRNPLREDTYYNPAASLTSLATCFAEYNLEASRPLPSFTRPRAQITDKAAHARDRP